MKEEKPEVKKPNEIIKAHAMDHICIRDKKTGKELVNKRG